MENFDDFGMFVLRNTYSTQVMVRNLGGLLNVSIVSLSKAAALPTGSKYLNMH